MGINWSPEPPRFDLAAGQVHVWAVALTSAPTPGLEELLSPDERDRAGRFYFADDRSAYVITHGVLRLLLERYTKQPAATVRFIQGPHGKPRMESTDLAFNLAHTRGLALLAFGSGTELGVDVEWQGRPAKILEIAARFFSPREQKDLTALPELERILGFFNGWTRKEAVLKACGLGLSVSPETIDVSILPGEPACVRQTPSVLGPAAEWSLVDLCPGPSYTAALALKGAHPSVETYSFER